MFNSSQKNNKFCYFMAYGSKEKKIYAPADISGYRFDEGKYYVSKRVPVYNDTLSLFVEYIMQARASFYYVKYNSTDHYYIETSDGFSELSEPEKINIINNTHFYKHPGYYGKLTFYLDDCPEIRPAIQNTKLNHKDLISLGQEYHRLTCATNDCVVFERDVKSTVFTIGPLVGFAVSSVSFGGMIWDKSVGGFFAGVKTNMSNILSSDERLSLGFDAYIQYNRTLNLSLASKDIFAELVKYDGTTYYLTHEFEDTLGNIIIRTKNLNVEANLLTLKMPLVISYNFGSGKIHYSFSAGGICSFTLSQNRSINYWRFSEVYDKTVPNFLYGGIIRGGIEYDLRGKTTVFTDLSFDSMINTGDVDLFTRLKFKSLSFRAGFRF